ncbi:MAG: ABC transporter permease [Terracidiphilus sp.]
MRKIPLWRRYSRLLGPDPAADVTDELRFHLEAKTEDLVNRGWSRDEARREAERQFGDVRAVQQVGERLGEKMERRKRFSDYRNEFGRDIRHTLRSFRKNSGFAAIAILVLALGIGVNAAVFSVVNTLLLRPLPFPDSQRLVWFTGGKSLATKIRASAGLSAQTYTVDAYEEFKRNTQSFHAVTSYQTFYSSIQYKLTGRGEPQQLVAVEIAENFLSTLGVRPALGRDFTREECQKGGRAAVMLSYYFWKNQFAADPAIVGKDVIVNGKSVTVVGVLPASFDFGAVFAPGMKVDVFVPAVMDFWRTWGNTLAVVGRLKPGVSVAQAQDEADRLFPHLKVVHPDWYEDYASDLTTLKDHVSGQLRRSLVVLWSAVGMILLIVCVNLSNLQLSRAATRSKELAMRRALGASRSRVIRQLLTESMVLSIAGAALGLCLAAAIVFYLAHQASITLPLLTTIRLDSAALGWTLLIALTAGILFGLAPAFKLSGADLQTALKDNGNGMAAGRSHERFRATLVVSEIALACILLVGAGLLLRSFLRVLDVDLGFEPSHAASMQVDYDDGGKLENRGPILQEMLRRVSALPGVDSAGISDMLPLDRNRTWGIAALGTSSKDRDTQAFVYVVTPGYIPTLGMRIRAGRDFNWTDTPASQHVVIINEAAARREWPGQNPIGKMAEGIEKNPVRVIGVISDVRESSLEAVSSPEIYVPMTQNADAEGATLVVRSRVSPESLASSVLTTLRSLNPGQPAAEFRPLQMLVDHAVSPRRFFVLLVTIFAGLGVLLAALGIYGVISYSVTQKTQEIGVRMALGATAGRVLRDVMTGTLRLTLAGIALGTVASLVVARPIASLLFSTSPWDVRTFLAMVAALLTVALIAGYVPARRASRVSPMSALRND